MAVPLKVQKAKLPHSLRCLGVKFRVELVDSDKLDGNLGVTDGELRVIRIDNAQDTRRQWTTLIHEYVHATLHVVGLANKLNDESEEVVAQSLEHSMEQLLIQCGPQILESLDIACAPEGGE